MKKYLKKESGSLILETSIVLPIFILVMVFVLGLFNVVYAQNQITHTLIQTTTSLSLDSYLNDKVNSWFKQEASLEELDDVFIELKRSVIAKDPHFTSKTDWYSTKDADLEEGETLSGDESIARLRFIGYLTGGDEDAAQDRLEALGVINGLSGMQFTVNFDDKNVVVTSEYTLQFWADYFGIGKIPMKQSITSKLW